MPMRNFLVQYVGNVLRLPKFEREVTLIVENLTWREYAPVETTEFATMRGVMQASYYRCKRCGMLVPGFSDTVGTHRPRYCSNCGAKAVEHEQA